MSIEEAVQTAPPPEQNTSADDVPTGELFVAIYRFFYSKVVGLALIIAMTIFALVGVLIMQAPPEVYRNPESRADFLDAATQNYGGLTKLLDVLGFFHVFTSIPFYIVVGALTLSIIACTTHRLPVLLARKNKPRVHVSDGFFNKARFRAQVDLAQIPALAKISEEAESERVLAVTTRVLKQKRFRVLPDPRSDGSAIYADTNAWAGVGTVISHLSFITILAAFVVSSAFGVEEDLALPVGRPQEIGHGAGITMEATSFQDSYTEDGRPSDYVSHLVATENGETVAEQDVRVNEPLKWGKFRYHQASFGLAADVKIEDENGDIIFDESVPLKWRSNGDTNMIGKFTLPDATEESMVAVAASGQSGSSLAPGEAHVILADDVEGVTLSQGTPAKVGSYNVTFERERQYTGIRMRHDPGAPLMWAGSALLVIGMCITFAFPYRRVWISSRDGLLRFGSVGRADTGTQKLIDSLATQLQTELGKETNDGK